MTKSKIECPKPEPGEDIWDYVDRVRASGYVPDDFDEGIEDVTDQYEGQAMAFFIGGKGRKEQN